MALKPMVDDPWLTLFASILDRDDATMAKNKVSLEENKVLVWIVVLAYLVIPESESKPVLHWTLP